MNKTFKRILCGLLILSLISLVVLQLTESFSVKDEDRVYSAALTVAEKNENLYKRIEKVEKYATEFKAANPSVKNSVTELTLQFIRKDTYSSGGWITLAGFINSDFVNYVASKDSTLKFTSNDFLYDPHSGKQIDFVHMTAALNCYYLHGDEVTILMILTTTTHYAGWAGDLLQMVATAQEFRETYPDSTQKDLSSYVNTLIGTNNSSTFDYKDTFADFDAHNINKLSSLKTTYSKALREYYTDSKGTGNNAYNRMETFRSNFSSKDQLKSDALSYINNSTVANFILADKYKSLYKASTASDRSIVATEFAEYVYGKTFIATSYSDINFTIGESTTRNITEKNIVESNAITYDSDLVDVGVNNFILTVKAKSYGKTTIKIKNGTNGYFTIPVTVKNIKPSIIENPIEEIDDMEGRKVEVSFSAGGTANKYRWYVYDSNNLNSNKEYVTETIDPVIQLELKGEYHNKYLRCEVINEGNSAVYTKPVRLYVTGRLPGVVYDDEEIYNESTNGNSNGTVKPSVPNGGITNNIVDNNVIIDPETGEIIQNPDAVVDKVESKYNNIFVILLVLVIVISGILGVTAGKYLYNESKKV